MAIVGWLVALALGIVLALFSVGNQQAAVLVISLVDRVRWFMASRFTKKVLTEHKRMIMQRDDRISELEQEVLRLRGAA